MKMKLSISIGINAALLAAVIFLWAERRQEGPATLETNGFEARPQTIEPGLTSPRASAAGNVKPFTWGQLESSNYRTYISNLRRIRCPEQTIRDIIAADVDASLYAPRREQLKSNQARPDGASQPSIARQNLEAVLEQLNIEEAALIATLLGWPVVPGQVVTGAREQIEQEATPIAIPLVLREVDLPALGLENQTNVIANLCRQFVEEIGGTNQDPHDPAYHERWRRAEAHANRVLEGMIGMRAYQAYDLQARAMGLPRTATASMEKP